MTRKMIGMVIALALTMSMAACGTLHTMDLGATRNGSHLMQTAHAGVIQRGFALQQA